MNSVSRMLGYTDELLILPFDHRNSFRNKVLGHKNPATQEEVQRLCELKDIIYEGLKLSLEQGVPKERMGVLVDEEYGSNVLVSAKSDGFIRTLCVEKSGQKEFDFEHGNDFRSPIEKINPEFIKVLVRVNTEDTSVDQSIQLARLKELDTYLKSTDRKLIFELLVPPTEQQLETCGSKARYDNELRPELMKKAVELIQDYGIEPDVWKLEGLNESGQWTGVVKSVRRGDRSQVGIIILGRGEDDAKVEEWLRAAKKVPGMIGFAVGRTVFLEAVLNYYNKKISREDAAKSIANKYSHFCKVWID